MIAILISNIKNLNTSLQVGDMIYATSISQQVDEVTDFENQNTGINKLVGILRQIRKEDNDIVLDVVRLFTFLDLPSVFQRYIILKASGKAATQLVSNPQLVQLLATQEIQARAACLEYECNQGNHSMFGLPEDSSYTAYEPWRNLAR